MMIVSLDIPRTSGIAVVVVVVVAVVVVAALEVVVVLVVTATVVVVVVVVALEQPKEANTNDKITISETDQTNSLFIFSLTILNRL